MHYAIAATWFVGLAAHGVAARAAVRGAWCRQQVGCALGLTFCSCCPTGFVPTVGNGAGYLIPPSGASGCGYDLASCFPAAYATVSGALAQLQAAYSAPGGIPPGLDALAPFSAAAAAKLARDWAAAGDAGRDVDALADTLADLARRDATPWAQAAGAAGAAAIGTAIDAKAADAAALQDAAQEHADDTLAAAQRVSDAAAALAAAAARP